MTTLEMRAAMEARRNAPPWPQPEQPAVEVEPTDERVPAGARSVLKLADGAGWQCQLTYARGTSMVGPECRPGPVVASVMLRARRESELAVVLWVTKPKAACPGCGNLKTPTSSGLIAKHGKGVQSDRDGEMGECAGSGQRATLNPITTSDYSFLVAYATEGSGWWSGHGPEHVNVTQLKQCLRGKVATVVEALRQERATSTP